MPLTLISPTQTARIKEAAELHVVAANYGIKLRPSGSDRWMALCCFHNERSPSLTFHKQGFYKCFSCGAAGDVITFVQAMERTSFARAARMLADQFGVRLDSADTISRDHLRTAQLLAAESRWWHEEVRLRYAGRLHLLVGMLTIYSDLSDGGNWEESMYRRYARRAWRFNKRVRKLAESTPAQMIQRWARHKAKHPAAVLEFRRAQALDASVVATWGRIVQAAREGKVSELMCWRMCAVVLGAWRYGGTEEIMEGKWDHQMGGSV